MYPSASADQNDFIRCVDALHKHANVTGSGAALVLQGVTTLQRQMGVSAIVRKQLWLKQCSFFIYLIL